MVSPETWLEMYSNYKKKMAGQISNKWSEFEVKMPIDWAKVIAARMPSGE